LSNTEYRKEKVILFAVRKNAEDDTEQSLDELAELCDTAGAQVCGSLIQNLEYPVSGTYFGKGKIEELGEYVQMLDADGVVCDDELSPAQMRNLEMMLGCKVMDRTMVILDIFAAHATTAEGKIQVELAQLRYRLSRLGGMGTEMSRLGGGIGTRGPGEKKLEVDRRRIRSRIGQLKAESKEIKAHRELTREHRNRTQMPVAAIVGYTNAGKSTLLNSLTGAGILAEDMLFATLDTTTRVLKLSGKQEILLTDTVGFIRKLPHGLIDAFRSTLEEAKYADYIIHVVDASSTQMDAQMATVYETLDELGVSGKKIITLFNKTDKLTQPEILRDFRAEKSLRISAKNKTGLDEVKDSLEELLRDDKVLVERVLGYEKMSLIAQIHKRGEVLEEAYESDGIHIKAYIPLAIYGILDD